MSDLDSKPVQKYLTKQRKVLIKFKSMQQILNDEHAAWFDGYGNLTVYSYNGIAKITPSSFTLLGRTVEMPSHHSYPNWCIEKQYDDLFFQNAALRNIASGKMDPADAVDLAKRSVLVPVSENEEP